MNDKKYTCAVFDLDGTLLNTLDDLKDSMNYALSSLGFPERTLDEIRSFVGNGLRKLAERSLPSSATKEDFDACMDIFMAHYAKNMQNKTAPYDGVMSVLKALSENDVKIAIVTNKGNDRAVPLCSEMFGVYPDVVIGEKPGIAVKPAPDGVFAALEALDADRENSVYIGDSEVDFATAANSGLDFIGCSWGFRGRKVLEELGADTVLDRPEELIAFFC